MQNQSKQSLFISILFLGAILFAGAQDLDSRYDAGLNLPFNSKAGDVNPQSGNLSLSFTDLSLPGRAGMDFTFSRSWNLNRSNVFAMSQTTYDKRNLLTSDTIEAYNHLGVGWSSSLPYIFEDDSAGSATLQYLVYGEGNYQLKTDTLAVYDDDESNIQGYDLLDLRVYSGAPGRKISYGDFAKTLPAEIADSANDFSKYVLILRDNSRYYFRPDGQVMMEQDRSGLNTIWYFYKNYSDGTSTPKSRLALVVDSLGREISFHYSKDEGNLEEISWTVDVGEKSPDGSRSLEKNIRRSVKYSYQNAEENYPDIKDLSPNKELSPNVLKKLTPYALETVTDPEGNLTRYSYQAGQAAFSYDSAFSRSKNVYLLLASITGTEDEDGFLFRNKQIFEYSPPASGMHTKKFYNGFMEYYKVSRRYFRDRHDNRNLNDTRYIYHKLGERGNSNEYQTVIQQGGLTSTYVYTVSETPRYDQVLNRLVLESSDGFLERTDFSYDANRAKTQDQVSRHGTSIYTEDYSYDDKGNLTRKEDRSGLVTSFLYDPIFSIPTRTLKSFTSKGISTVRQEYKSTQILNNWGQVTEQRIYLKQAGILTPVSSALLEYDQYGNIISQTDANKVVVHTQYDATSTFPVKVWQTLSIDAWNDEGAGHWLSAPDSTKKSVKHQSWQVFNTDGTLWMEVDSAGHLVEHYYNAIGDEIETVHPDEDDPRDFASSTDIVDFYTDYLTPNPDYFDSRKNNPGVRIDINYATDFIRSESDIDLSQEAVHVTAVQGDGLDHVEEEIEYKNDKPYATKKMTYDTQGRMIALTDPDATSSSRTRTVNGNPVVQHDKTWIIKPDDLGRTQRVIYPETSRARVHAKEYSYNDLNNTTTITDPEGRRVIEKRDWNNNLIQQSALGDATTNENDHQVYSYEYDALNRRVKFTDPKGIVTRYRYDERDLLLEQNYGEEASDLMSYDNVGRLVEKTDRAGQVITFKYDEMGRNTLVTHYKKDGNDNGIDDFSEKHVDSTVATSYDRWGRMVRVENGSLIEHIEYDDAGRVAKLNRHLQDVALRKLLVDRVWSGSASDQILSFSYDYNDAGMITQMTYPDGGVHNFSYDEALARLKKIQADGDDFVSALSYNKSGVVTQMTYANDTVQNWSFDNRKRIAHIEVVKGSSQSITDLSYTLNGVGDILAVNDNVYEYDGFDRIVGAKTLIPGKADDSKLVAASFGTSEGVGPIEVGLESRSYNSDADLNKDGRVNGADHAKANFIALDTIYDVESFAYDKNGNRTRLVQNGDVYEYSYGERNRLESIRVTQKGEEEDRLFAEYKYDANGNTTRRTIHPMNSESQVLDLEYDTLNRLVQSRLDGAVTTYSYDNAGNRLVKTTPEKTTLYLRHGQIAVAMDIELPEDASSEKGRVNRYVLSGDLLAGRVTRVRAADGVESVEKSYYHLDHLNSTKAVTDDDGVLEVLYEYRAFGEQLKRLDSTDSETGDSAKYSYGGKELDAGSDLYYFNARYYDATIGRFINVDPIQDGSNWYVYVRNNPLGLVDPTGLEKEDLEQAGRALAVVSSAVELTVGIVLVATGVGGPAGVFLIVHGGANLLASVASTIAYESSDGDTELSTSALGMATQGLSFVDMRSEGVDRDVASDRAAALGSAADIVDGVGAMAVNPTNAAARFFSAAAGAVSLTGDVTLAATTTEDWISNARDRSEEAAKEARIESERIGKGL